MYFLFFAAYLCLNKNTDLKLAPVWFCCWFLTCELGPESWGRALLLQTSRCVSLLLGLQAGGQAAATDLQTAAAGPSGFPFNHNCICRGCNGVRTRRRILSLCVMWLRRANISASCSFRRRNAASANRVSAEASLCFSFSRFLSREAFTWRRKLQLQSW